MNCNELPSSSTLICLYKIPLITDVNTINKMNNTISKNKFSLVDNNNTNL